MLLKWRSRPKFDQSCTEDSGVREPRLGAVHADGTAHSGRWWKSAPGPQRLSALGGFDTDILSKV